MKRCEEKEEWNPNDHYNSSAEEEEDARWMAIAKKNALTTVKKDYFALPKPPNRADEPIYFVAWYKNGETVIWESGTDIEKRMHEIEHMLSVVTDAIDKLREEIA